MEVLFADNKKNIVMCPHCFQVVKFKINSNNFTVSIECKNGHNEENISLEGFISNYIKQSIFYEYYCNRCYKSLNNEFNNYRCQICNGLYCSECLNSHTLETKHNSKIKYIQQFQLCQKHEQKYSLFCETCKINICEDCKNIHNNHILKSFFDVMLNKSKLNSIIKDSEKYTEKINHILDTITLIKKNFEIKLKEIQNYLGLLKRIKEYLINNFNNNYYDYYNFSNINYLLSFFNRNDIYDINEYIKSLILICNNNQVIFNVGGKTDDGNYISNFCGLKYLKENIFYNTNKKSIKFYEFKDYSLNFISNIDIKYNIYNIIPSKYSNSLLIDLECYKKIKIVEYDLLTKIFKLSKKYITSDIKYNTFRTFNISISTPKTININFRCIDNINGNFVTSFKNNLEVWKKDPKKNKYTIFMEIKDINGDLFNINSNLFCCYHSFKYKLYFYNTKNYECCGILNFSDKDGRINLIGAIEDNELIFFKNDENKIIVIDAKYIEIVQIIGNDKEYLKMKDNYLLSLYLVNGKLNYIKKIFDKNKKIFKTIKDTDKETNLRKIRNIIITNIGYVVICDFHNLIFVNI